MRRPCSPVSVYRFPPLVDWFINMQTDIRDFYDSDSQSLKRVLMAR